MLNGFTIFMLAVVVVGIPVVGGLLYETYRISLKHKEKMATAMNAQAAEKAAQRIRQVCAQHVKAAVRQIDHAHDAEDQRQAGRQHEQQQPVLHAVQQLDQDIGEIHRIRRCGG